MAEKKSNAKNVEKGNSTLATTSEKATKTTAKKADSKATKTDAAANKTATKATEKAAKPTASKATTEKAAKPATSKASTEKVAKSSTDKTTASKTQAEKATTKTTSKASESKPTVDKSAAKTSSTKSAEKTTSKSTGKASEKNGADKATSKATATTKASVPKATEQKEAATKTSADTKSKQDKASKEVAATKAPTKTAKKDSVPKAQDIKADSAQTTTAVYGTSMAASRAKSKKAEDTVASDSASTTPKVSSKKASTKKATPKVTDNAKSNRMVASKAAKNDNKAKFDIKNFAKDSAVAIKGIFTNKKTRVFGIVAIAAVLLFILILSISVGAATKANGGLSADSRVSSVKDYSLEKGSTYDYEYRTTAVVGYQEEYLEYNEPRKIPADSEITNQGFVDISKYPKYGYTPSGITENDRRELINEAWKLCSINTRIGSDGFPKNTYNKMDKDGNLYLDGNRVDGTQGTPSKLYKHTCAVGMYHGDVSDDEKPISKRMTFNPRSFHHHGMYNVTGIYAPAGEVLKVEISEEDMDVTGGIIIYIGQALYNSKANNIWLAKGQMQRFPVILNTMYITKDTAIHDEENHKYIGYVGSFLGGPVYVGNEGKTFTTTISGGVRYSHFILGHTTPEDFDANKDSSAPYFDLEVWDNGVLHSGPKRQAQNFSYDDLFKVAELWDKVTAVTTTGNNQNIVFLYDPFVAAGAAVAFPGQHAVNCPEGWMASSLNYEALIKGGSWGNFHEYHHNFQGYGVGNGGEVTNNALTLVSYALFTKISSNRRIESLGASGLGGWNSYTSATWALDQVKAIADPSRNPSNGNQGLALYATLLHNFGADAFIQVRKLGGGQSYANYFKKWEQYTHNNMTYYFKEMLKGDQFGNLTDDWLEKNSNPDYPMFVPISSVYQTGRSWTYDNETKYFKTMQPYVIPYGEKFTIDLGKYEMDADGSYKSGSIVLPEGFSYEVLNVSQPQNGTITKVSDKIYIFDPSKDMLSGDIYVTLKVTHDKYKVGNIDLILGFEQSHDLTGRTLERVTYQFDGDTTYTSAKEAFESDYAGYTNKVLSNNVNKTQNSNTDIWLVGDEITEAVEHNSIMEVRGKIHITEAGKYRFQIRGRANVALFLAVNEIPTSNKNYKYSCQYTTNTANSPYFPTIQKINEATGKKYLDQLEGTYCEIELNAGDWVYLRAVMVAGVRNNKASFVGVGVGKVPTPMPQVDENGDVLYEIDPITGEKVPKPDIQDPTTISYANAYRDSFQFTDNLFAPEYFYYKTYTHAYLEQEKIIETKQQLVSYSNFEPYAGYEATRNIDKICDGDIDTFIHSKKMPFNEENPFEVVVKFDEAVTANKFRIHYSKIGGAFIGSRPKNYTLEIKLNETDEWKLVANVKDAACADYMHTQTLDTFYTFQYYRFVVTDTYYDIPEKPRFMVINELQFISQLEISGGNRTAVGDKKVKLYGSWNIQNTPSKFGRVYVGKENSSMEFEFTGTRLILFSSINLGTNFEVYIDGKKINSINIEATNEICRESFISPVINNKKHSVSIKCLGEANIESIVILN